MNLSRSLLSLALALSASAVFAQAPQLRPQAERITDEAIQADHATFEAQQLRLRRLNEGGRVQADYHLSKAQCWLDVSFHEYTRNDRSAFPQQALEQSARLATAMENKVSPLPFDTPHVNGAEPIRPDLWARAGALRQHGGFQCAQQATACGEVELVHAANENTQQGWRHARPYVQMAEDRLALAEQQAAACLPPPRAPAPAPVVVPAPAPAAVSLDARVLFAFDKAGRDDIRPESLVALRRLADDIRARGVRVESLQLTGHADRLNSTGNAGYNVELSRQRVETVRALLTELGVVAATVQAQPRGDTQPVDACTGPFASRDALQDCLLVNRRVDVVVRGSARP
ncbi:MAG: OmpA family protein [Burkholderiales bacterium]|nr:OmpA family protein [Burkholderiales bacterium]